MNEAIIHLKGVVMEDFVNYAKPSLFLITCKCDWKCCHEANIPITVCQNEPVVRQATKEFLISSIYKAYIDNEITKAVVIGGLEPMLQFEEILSLLDYFRKQNCNDDFIIYTGYYKEEIKKEIEQLKKYPNVILKYGRYKPNSVSHFDETLKITLASDNQYAERIS